MAVTNGTAGIQQRESILGGVALAAMVAPAGPQKDPIIEGQAWFTDEQVQFIMDRIPGVLLQGQLSNGPWTAEFETAVARNAGTKYATAFPSGTAALEAALTALGVGAGDEVLLPVQSFVGNAMAVRLVGATPIFCDITAATHCLDPEEITRKATPRTKAAILVHMGGLISPDIAEILGRCEAKGLLLIEDCSQAHGAHWHGRPAGSLGAAGVYSFQSARVLTTGEGGAVVTNNRALSRIVRSLQNRGRDMDAKTEAYARNGHNNRFPEVSALLGLAQYRSLPQLVAKRNETAAYYRARLREEAPAVGLQAHPANIEHSYNKFIINLPQGVSRHEVKLFLHRRGVPVSLCFAPLHRQPLFSDLGDPEAAKCPVADDVLERSLCLPIDPRISEAQRKKVIDVLLEALKHEGVQPAS
jgi:dTDP-4-amino-4,6-dideoxygalactose transaminase